MERATKRTEEQIQWDEELEESEFLKMYMHVNIFINFSLIF